MLLGFWDGVQCLKSFFFFKFVRVDVKFSMSLVIGGVPEFGAVRV